MWPTFHLLIEDLLKTTILRPRVGLGQILLVPILNDKLIFSDRIRMREQDLPVTSVQLA